MPSQSKFWGILFGAAAALCGLLFIVSPALGWWLPTGASSYSGGIDFLFYLILGVVGFFFVLTEGVLVYNMVKYRHQPGRKAELAHGNHRLEIIWSAIPAAILLALALWQVNAWAEAKYQSRLGADFDDPQKPAPLQVEVQARQWEWRVRYPGPERLAGWNTNKNDAK